jgi:hypothetical protein
VESHNEIQLYEFLPSSLHVGVSRIYLTIILQDKCRTNIKVASKEVQCVRKRQLCFFLHLYVLGLLYHMTLCTKPPDCDVRTRSAVSRNVDLGTRYVTVCVVSLVAGRSVGKRDNDNKRYTMRRMVL